MAKGCALSTGYLPRGGLPKNSVDRITDRPDMTSAFDHGRKASTQTNKKTRCDNLKTSVLFYLKKFLLKEGKTDNTTGLWLMTPARHSPLYLCKTYDMLHFSFLQELI